MLVWLQLEWSWGGGGGVGCGGWGGGSLWLHNSIYVSPSKYSVECDILLHGSDSYDMGVWGVVGEVEGLCDFTIGSMSHRANIVLNVIFCYMVVTVIYIMITTRYIDCTPTSEVTPVTIRYFRPSHHGHTSQYIILTHLLFISHQSDQEFPR